jgi:multidrug efflux system outer membrane protein
LQTPTEVIRQRPDVREAERKLASSTALEGSAIADWFPKLSLGGYYGTQKTTLMPGQGIWSITPDLSIPLFNFGRIQSQVDFSKAQAQEAFFTYKKTVISALEEVETHLTELVNVQKRYQLLKQSARANQTAVTLASERYQKGISNFINVLNSEQDLYSTENQTASAEAEQAKKVVAIYKSLGQNVWDEQQID